MKRAERIQDRGANPLTSTIRGFDMNKELKNALQKHYKLCYCYGCKNNPEKCHCAFKSFYDGGEFRIDWCGKQVETNRVVS
jgi:hypothetical protein